MIIILSLLLIKAMTSLNHNIQLYAFDVSNYCSSVKIALQYKGLEYSTLSPPDGYGSIEYKKIISMGTIPALIVNGVSISESQVILEYLDQKYPNTNQLFLSDPDKNAKLRLAHRLHDLYLEPLMRALFKHMDPNIRDNDLVKEKFDLFNNRLIQLENIIEEGDFFINQQFSVAECIYPPTLLMADMMSDELGQLINYDNYPKLKAWYSKIKTHPSIAPTLGKAQKATQNWIEKKRNDGVISKCSL